MKAIKVSNDTLVKEKALNNSGSFQFDLKASLN